MPEPLRLPPLVFRPRDPMPTGASDDHVRQELLTHLTHLREDVKTGFAGVHARLDTQNGRINGLEKRDAAHHERIGALEGPASTPLDTDPFQSRKRTAVTLSLGAGGGALVVKLLELAAKALSGS